MCGTQACRNLPSTHRILMTGTPIVNSLKEMWVLFEWACKGRLLGNDYRAFKREYEDAIVKGCVLFDTAYRCAHTQFYSFALFCCYH